MSSNERLHELATLIADGTPIDWKSEERTLEPDDLEVLRSLRLVASVSSLQGLPDDKPTFGHLELLEKIGQGSYGTVYKAWDSRLDRVVALKVLEGRNRRSDRTSRSASPTALLAEGRRLASIKHSNVVTVYGADVIEERAAVWMEYVEGRTLAELTRLQGTFGPEEIINVGVQLCRAVAAVHGAGLLHQDIKAQNVMREHGGRVVLMDFGPGGTTPLYTAPEILRGASPDVASDLYSVGVLLYHLATGSYPIVATRLDELKDAHDRAQRLHLRDVRPSLPLALNQVIERCIAPTPGERFASAGEMEAALERARVEAASETSMGARAADARAAHGPTTSRLRRPALALAFALGALALGFGIWSGGRDRARPPVGSQVPPGVVLPIATSTDAFRVQARFYRGAHERDLLTQGDHVAVGDSVSMSVESSDSVYVYVVNEDDQGEALLLFPTSKLSPQNPLPPGTTHLLPGSRNGSRYYWQVTSAGGREHLVVLASVQRLVAFEAELLRLDRPEEGREPEYPALTVQARAVLRGLGGLVKEASPGAAQPSGRAAVSFTRASVLTPGMEDARGVWMRKLDLVNEAR